MSGEDEGVRGEEYGYEGKGVREEWGIYEGEK